MRLSDNVEPPELLHSIRMQRVYICKEEGLLRNREWK